MRNDLMPRAAPTRRNLLGMAGAVAAWGCLPRFAHAAMSDSRVVVVVLRGALDGLSAVPAIGDPAYSSTRAELANGAGGQGDLPLDGFFALHPSMPKLHKMYQAKELAVVHAVASPYRERSHFDGQDVLENGGMGPRAENTGWLNRAVGGLRTEGTIAKSKYPSLATTPTVPLILRGKAPVLTWIPPDLPQASADTISRVLDLYEHTDPEMAKVFAAGRDVNMMAGGDKTSSDPKGKALSASFQVLTTGAGRLLAQEQGPRVAAISFDGWDTHAREVLRLNAQLGALDDAMDALRTSLGPVWKKTSVLVITEFGRTVRKNGTGGTDHGTATVAFLLGGAVKGGKVIADWPGLSALYEGRDLKPTTDLRAVMKGVLRAQLDLPVGALANVVFPGSDAVRPLFVE